MRPSDLLAKGGHRRLLERAKRVPSRGCGQFAEPLPQPGRELKAKSRCLELRAKAWSREMRGHGYPHHPMSSVAMGRSSGGMDVDDGFGGGLTMTGHGWNPLATSEGRIGGERKVTQVACPRLQGKKEFCRGSYQQEVGGGGVWGSREKISHPLRSTIPVYGTSHPQTLLVLIAFSPIPVKSHGGTWAGRWAPRGRHTWTIGMR